MKFNKIILTTCLVILLNYSLSIVYAQTLPKICPQPAYMTKNCIDACLICDIDGFTGRNNSNGPGQEPTPRFCTNTNHNIRWIAFMASTPQLTLELQVRNCEGRDGLEVGIFESIDCKNFQQVSNCDDDVPPNTNVRLTFTKTIVEGQYYYLVIDGNRSDVCDYTVKVINGSTKVTPLDVSGNITGPLKVCQGERINYDVSFIKGAAWHFWYLNGIPLGAGNTKEVNWTNPGKFQLCAQAVNACDDAPANCIEVIVNPTFITSLDVNICKGEDYLIGKEILNTEGTHKVRLQSINSCDSIVNVNLKLHDPSNNSTRLNLCEGDTIKFNNKEYFVEGIFVDTLETSFGCDSILELAINVIKCNIQSKVIAEDIKCFGDKNGRLTFEVIDGTPPFTYQYENLQDPTVNGIGQITQLNAPVVINNLNYGDYQISITDFFGNKRIISSKVNQPLPIEIELKKSLYSNFSLKCYGDSDAYIHSIITGGTLPYKYIWSNGSSQDNISNLSAGKYSVTILDANNCPVESEAEITQPDSLTFVLISQDPSCENNSSGEIDLGNMKGGIGPYEFSINNQPFQNSWQFRNLSEGIYSIRIRDDNGCIKSSSIKITSPEHNNISKYEDYDIELGDSVRIILNYSSLPGAIQWIPSDHLSCTDCIDPFASPLNDTYYTLLTTSKDGCIDSIRVLVRVIKDKRIWAPNVFSPNGDGINDIFNISGTKSLNFVRKLQVFDRWGGLVYEGSNLSATDKRSGWNGFINGQVASTGVYSWSVQAEFLDGEIMSLSGDLTLIK